MIQTGKQMDGLTNLKHFLLHPADGEFSILIVTQRNVAMY